MTSLRGVSPRAWRVRDSVFAAFAAGEAAMRVGDGVFAAGEAAMRVRVERVGERGEAAMSESALRESAMSESASGARPR